MLFLRSVDYVDNGDKKTLQFENAGFLNLYQMVNYLAAFFLATAFLIFLASSVNLVLEVDSR